MNKSKKIINKKDYLYPISEITLKNGKFVVKDLQHNPKKLILKELNRLDNNLKSMYITNRWQVNWFDKLTESRLIIRKLYTLID